MTIPYNHDATLFTVISNYSHDNKLHWKSKVIHFNEIEFPLTTFDSSSDVTHKDQLPLQRRTIHSDYNVILIYTLSTNEKVSATTGGYCFHVAISNSHSHGFFKRKEN